MKLGEMPSQISLRTAGIFMAICLIFGFLFGYSIERPLRTEPQIAITQPTQLDGKWTTIKVFSGEGDNVTEDF